MFLHGLADRIQKEIFTVELPTGLDGLIELALRVDARLQQRDQRGRHRLVSELPSIPLLTPVIRSVSHPMVNPCRWEELGFPGRRGTVGEQRDFAYIAVLRVTSWLTVQ